LILRTRQCVQPLLGLPQNTMLPKYTMASHKIRKGNVTQIRVWMSRRLEKGI
jgi:hypothetical protein